MLTSQGLSVHFFPPSHLGIYALAEGANLRRLHGSAAIVQTKSAAVLDGPMYDDVGSGLARPRFLMFDSKRNLYISTRSPRDGMTISVKDGRAYVHSDAQTEPGSTVAVQLYPELVRGGRNMANAVRDTSTVWRAALGIHRDGRLGFAVGVFPMHEFASRLIGLGFIEAGYTDGGDSTLLLEKDGAWTGDRDHRAVSSWLLDEEKASEETGSILAAIGVGWLLYELMTSKP